MAFAHTEIDPTRRWSWSRRGRRARSLLLVPGIAVKVARDATERQALRREVEAARIARRATFWSRHVVPLRPGGPGIGVSRRWVPATLADVDGLERHADGLLDIALGHPGSPVADLVAAGEEVRLIPGDAVRRAVSGWTLPATGMHGDYQVHNLVRRRGEIAVIDWEHFDPSGSFVFDYLNLFISRSRWQVGSPWDRYLSVFDEVDEALLDRTAARVGVPRPVLSLYYAVQRVRVMVQRAGGVDAMTEATRTRLGAALARRAHLALEVAPQQA